MLPFLYFFGLPIPMYALMALVGLVVSALFAARLAKVYGLSVADLLFAAVYMVIGIIAGSKILHFITYIPKLIENWDVVMENPWYAIMVSFGGYVFYGGLLGGALGVYIYSRQFKVDLTKYADSMAPVIPLFHAFGRLGCFFGGCCYGKEYHGMFAVKYPENILVPELADVERFPVQLMECGLNLVLFIFLFIFALKKRKSYMTLGIYLIAYAVIRTITEMFRGDIIRGVSEIGLSTSQIISIILLPIGLWMVFKKEKTNEE